MTKDEALQMCLEYIETDAHERKYVRHAIKAALANEALERKAENARELGLDYEPLEAKDEPVAWRDAAIRLGEELSSVGPNGYYDMDAKEWLDWAMEQNPRGEHSLPKRKPLTDEQIQKCYETTGHYQTLRPQDRFAVFALARAIEAAHGIKGEA